MEAPTTIVTPQQQLQHFPPKPQSFMTSSICYKLFSPPLLRLSPAASFGLFTTISTPVKVNPGPEIVVKLPEPEIATLPEPEIVTLPEPEIVTLPEPSKPSPSTNGSRRRKSMNKKVTLDANHLKMNWLNSLSSPLSNNCYSADSGWIIGIDPDLSGALAVLKPDNSPQVYDSPHLKVLVGKTCRRRLDTKSIIQLLQSVDAPIGTTAYLEQSIPYPQDGKQGWWSGGFGYGLWIGVLVASGYSVVPVPSLLWKNEFKLAGKRSSKDDSRELASTLFPSVSYLLKRKKDHGRAEALLIAAYGKGLKATLHSSCISEVLVP